MSMYVCVRERESKSMGENEKYREKKVWKRKPYRSSHATGGERPRKIDFCRLRFVATVAALLVCCSLDHGCASEYGQTGEQKEDRECLSYYCMIVYLLEVREEEERANGKEEEAAC